MKIFNSQLKIVLTSILFIVLFQIKVVGQELTIKSFKQLENNTTARVHKKRDINSQYCAILILKHNFKDFTIETGIGDEGIIEKKGETWIWLSADEYRIVIKKDRSIPLEYNLKNKLKPYETYELVVIDEYASLKVTASDSKIWLDDKFAGTNEYVFNNLKEGRYILKATKDKYYEEEELLILNAGDNLDFTFNLKPKMGKLVINSNPSGANIFIGDSLIISKTNTTIPLIIGNYKIKVEKQGFLPYVNDAFIYENKNTQFNAKMEADPTLTMIKHKKKRNFWMISTIVSASVGGYAYMQSNKLYDEYETATDNAADLHKKVDTYDKIAPVAFGVAGFCLVEYIIHASKYGKAKRRLKLHPSYNKNGGSLSLNYTF